MVGSRGTTIRLAFILTLMLVLLVGLTAYPRLCLLRYGNRGNKEEAG